MPESCVLIVIGILIGVIMYYAFGEELNVFPQFTAELFFNCLLPPIILGKCNIGFSTGQLSWLNIVVVLTWLVLHCPPYFASISDNLANSAEPLPFCKDTEHSKQGQPNRCQDKTR